MKRVIQTPVDATHVQLDARASAKEVSEAVDRAQIMFANKMGLTPERGKTPAQAAAEQLGIKDLDSVVQNDVLEYLWPFAVDQRKLTPAYPPRATSMDILRRGKDFDFSMIVMLKPKYEISSYDPITIQAPAFEPDLSEVDNMLKTLGEQYSEYVTKSDAADVVASGDTILIKMETTLGGAPMPNLTFERRPYVAGEGNMPQEFDDQVIGMKVGETKTITFKAPMFDQNRREVMTEMESTVTIIEQQMLKPPVIDDAWVARYMPRYANREEMIADMEQFVTAQQREKYNASLRDIATAEIGKRFEGEIANEVYESMRDTMLQQLQTRLAAQKMKLEDYVEEIGGQEQLNLMLLMEVRQTLSQGYALDAVYRHFNLKVESKDIDGVCNDMAPNTGTDMRKQMEDAGRNFALRESAERRVAADYLVEHAIIEQLSEGETEE